MKVALVHDYIKEYGGAERVLEALHEIFPDAPVYTSVYLPKFLGPHQERFKNWKKKTSFLQYIPFKAKLISLFRIISPFVFRQFDFSGYDVVIVSATGAYFPNCIRCHPERSEGSLYNRQGILRSAQNDNKKNQNDIARKPIHICYCHTPPRYLYGYMTARDWKNNPVFRFFGEIANHFLRIVDVEASQNVDFYIANSEEVKRRIRKFYRREVTVVYPPVETAYSLLASSVQLRKDQKLNANSLDAKRYYLTGGRLARAKGIDIVIDAFIKLGKPLKIFGRGFAGWEKNIKDQISPLRQGFEGQAKIKDSSFAKASADKQKSKIEFVGEVNDEEKFKLMKNAKAFVFASYDEDFGITPVEAMSVGTPVIAYKSGGVQETVLDGKTGVFYNTNTAEELIKAVQRFEKLNIDPKNCINQAKKFSKERFEQKIINFIKNLKINK